MQFDEFLDLVRKRRSIRRFRPDPIPDIYVEKMLEAARWAMSGANAQPWEFIVVKDPHAKTRIARLFVEAQKETYVIEQTRVEELRHHQFRIPPKPQAGFKDAPVIIVICGDRRTLQATVLSSNFSLGPESSGGGVYMKSMGNATQILHLAAAALGLASQWISVNRLFERSLQALLEVPGIIEIHTIVPVGYPAYESPPAYRRALNEIIHFEKYDKSKLRSGEDIIEFLQNLRRQTHPAYQPERE